jgi:glutamyl-tRNA synthetase
MILGQDRTRLSKRHGATSVMAYRDMGYLPEALVNYLVRLGWSHGDQEIFSRDELVAFFTLENVGKSPGVFNPDKLLWLNAHYLKEKAPDDLVPLVAPLLADHGHAPRPGDYLARAIATLQSRCQTLVELAHAMDIYLVDEVQFDAESARKFLTREVVEPFRQLAATLEAMNPFDQAGIEEAFRRLAAQMGWKLGRVAQPVRVALTGKTVSPGLFEVIEVLGRETVLKRLRRALGRIVEGS